MVTDGVDRVLNPSKNTTAIKKALTKVGSLISQAKSYSRIKSWLRFSSDKQLLEELQHHLKRAETKLELLKHRIYHKHG